MKPILLSLLIFSVTHASTRYFLCGPDEDGCSPNYYTSCLCMPYDELSSQTPYCLDFTTVACIPLAKKPNCPHTDIFKNQATCLATAFQSEAEPTCPLTSEEFCRSHNIPLCAIDGGMNSCN